MPGSRTHDVFTLLLAVPAAYLGFLVSESFVLAAAGAIGFLLGSFLFGPDLDTQSRQYSRWGFARIVWFPYKVFFKHRSRFTHGLLFGTLLRLIYLAGVMSLLVLLGGAVYGAITGRGTLASPFEIAGLWHAAGEFVRSNALVPILLAIAAGAWAGAAVHTITDIVGTYLKTGRFPRIW